MRKGCHAHRHISPRMEAEVAGLVLARLDHPTRLLLSWGSAMVLGLVLGTRLRWHHAAGIAIMSVPLWQTAWNFYNSAQVLLDPGSVLAPFSRYQLSSLYSRSILGDIGYLGTGFLLYQSGGRLRGVTRTTTGQIAARLRATGFPMGGRSEARSAAIGWAVFPIILFGAILIDVGASGFEVLQQGDESDVWRNMTVYHAVLISLAAGFGEELVYRGFLLTALLALFKRATAPMGERTGHQVAFGLAVFAQAVVFGFAHAGYGTVIHVLMPFLFAVVAGIVAWRFGIWSAIVVHTLIDLYVFGAEAGNGTLLSILGTLLMLNVLFTIGWVAYLGAKRVERWRQGDRTLR